MEILLILLPSLGLVAALSTLLVIDRIWVDDSRDPASGTDGADESDGVGSDRDRPVERIESGVPDTSWSASGRDSPPRLSGRAPAPGDLRPSRCVEHRGRAPSGVLRRGGHGRGATDGTTYPSLPGPRPEGRR